MPLQNKFNNVVIAIWLALGTQAIAEEQIQFLTRDLWGAKPAAAKMTKHQPVAILIHHTGSPQKPKTTLKSKILGLQRFSQSKEKLADGRTKPAWPDVPYHFYIAHNGQIAEGRNINAVGDTNTGYDPTGFIQVVVEGNFDKESVTQKQAAALKSLLSNLKEKYKITAIQSHQEKAQTACPGKDLAKKLLQILDEIE